MTPMRAIRCAVTLRVAHPFFLLLCAACLTVGPALHARAQAPEPTGLDVAVAMQGVLTGAIATAESGIRLHRPVQAYRPRTAAPTTAASDRYILCSATG